ncbi:MAG: hypothetical protein ABIM99_02765 [Candidatus Dojkabacteria bacterium]
MENETFLEEFKRYVANPKSRLFIFLGVSIVAVVSIALVFAVINNNNTSTEISKAKEIEENPAQKAEILTQIVKNNPKGVVNNNLGSGSAGSTSNGNPQNVFHGTSGYVAVDPNTGVPVGQGNTVAVGPEEQPDLAKYNYRKSTETFTPGVISNVCNDYNSTLQKNRFITAEFFDPQNSYYSRKSEYVDGTLQNYYNSHYSPTASETYSYSGGSYAVKQVYTPYWYSTAPSTQDVPSYPVASYPVSYAEISYKIMQYFGGTAVIRRVYQQANRTFYEIGVSYAANCANNTNPAISQYIDEYGIATIFSVYTIDAKTFEITNTKGYINHIDPTTLIYTRDYKVEYNLTEFSKVSTEFATNLTSDVKVVDWSSYVFNQVEYGNRLSNYMKDNALDILLPTNDLEFQYIGSKNTPPALTYAYFYKDRNYYTPGANGDYTYNDVMQRYGPNLPLLNYALKTKNGYPTYTFYQYEEGADYQKLLDSMRNYSPYGTTEFTKSININGEATEVTIMQHIYGSGEYPTSYPISYIQDLAVKYPTISTLSYPVSFPYQSYFYISYDVLFKYHGKPYMVYIQGWALDRFLNEAYQNINVGEQDGFNTFVNLIPNGTYGDGGFGYGY